MNTLPAKPAAPYIGETEARALLAASNIVGAIKLLRDLNPPLSLLECKDIVESWKHGAEYVAEMQRFRARVKEQKEAHAQTFAALRQTVFALESVLMLSGSRLPPASIPELKRYVESGKAAIERAEKAGEI